MDFSWSRKATRISKGGKNPTHSFMRKVYTSFLAQIIKCREINKTFFVCLIEELESVLCAPVFRNRSQTRVTLVHGVRKSRQGLTLCLCLENVQSEQDKEQQFHSLF